MTAILGQPRAGADRGKLRAATPRARAPWRWAFLGGLLGLAVTLVAFAPARWAAWAVERTSEGRLRLDSPRGTVWNGSAGLVVTGGAGSRDAATLPSRVFWQLRPALPATLRVRLAADCCTRSPLEATVSWSPGVVRWALADGPASHWPSDWLAGLGTPWNTLGLEGGLELATRQLRLEWRAQRLQVSGRAEVTVRDAATRLTPLRPVGSYRLTLEGGAVPSLHLETLQGGLQLSGRGQWVGGRLRFAGEARAQPGAEAALDNVLHIIGRRDGARSLITLG